MYIYIYIYRSRLPASYPRGPAGAGALPLVNKPFDVRRIEGFLADKAPTIVAIRQRRQSVGGLAWKLWKGVHIYIERERDVYIYIYIYIYIYSSASAAARLCPEVAELRHLLGAAQAHLVI